MRTLGGATMCYNGISQDYNFIETLNCLYELCDQVAISCGGDDGTIAAVMDWSKDKDNVTVILFGVQDWIDYKGHTKLSYFSNIAIEALTTDWICYVQCDEVFYEKSFVNIREAIELDHNGYVFNRYNAWKDPFHMLNLPQERKPCSTEVIRLAKRGALCYSDAEHIRVDNPQVFKSLDAIEIYHAGYIRNPVKHLVKIRHMLVDVFQVEMDKRAENCEEFIPERWFSDNDLALIPTPLPKFLTLWFHERYALGNIVHLSPDLSHLIVKSKL